MNTRPVNSSTSTSSLWDWGPPGCVGPLCRIQVVSSLTSQEREGATTCGRKETSYIGRWGKGATSQKKKKKKATLSRVFESLGYPGVDAPPTSRGPPFPVQVTALEG